MECGPDTSVVRSFIEVTLEHSQAPGAYVQACALLPPPSPLFQRKYRAHTPLPTLYTWGTISLSKV